MSFYFRHKKRRNTTAKSKHATALYQMSQNNITETICELQVLFIIILLGVYRVLIVLWTSLPVMSDMNLLLY